MCYIASTFKEVWGRSAFFVNVKSVRAFSVQSVSFGSKWTRGWTRVTDFQTADYILNYCVWVLRDVLKCSVLCRTMTVHHCIWLFVPFVLFTYSFMHDHVSKFCTIFRVSVVKLNRKGLLYRSLYSNNNSSNNSNSIVVIIVVIIIRAIGWTER